MGRRPGCTARVRVTAGRVIRIGTRRSPLALAQSGAVASALGQAVLVPFVTEGDRRSASGDAAAGGREDFVRGLDEALLRGAVDLCVHSAKDLPIEIPPGLCLAAYPRRQDPRDAMAGGRFRRLEDLPQGAVLGSGSPRRAAQLLALRPDVSFVAIRGNVDTRLGRVAKGEFAACVLAVAGLVRLGRTSDLRQVFSVEEVVPAAGQGALVVMARSDDVALWEEVARLNDPDTAFAVTAERAVVAALGGGCAMAAGAYAECTRGIWNLLGALTLPEGHARVRITGGSPAGTGECRDPLAPGVLSPIAQAAAATLGMRCAAALRAGTGTADRGER